ncbi:MAG: DUF4438 domain-containing protein [Bacillota bacterium]
MLACLGNEAIVVSGKAEGARGVVTGKHGGAERVMVDFDRETMEKIVIGDKVLIRAHGAGGGDGLRPGPGQRLPGRLRY